MLDGSILKYLKKNENENRMKSLSLHGAFVYAFVRWYNLVK